FSIIALYISLLCFCPGIPSAAIFTLSLHDALPILGKVGTAALLPTAITEFGEGLELPRAEVMLFFAAREAAHHRLFHHVPWLASDRKSTRLNSSHVSISYAVFCLKKKIRIKNTKY